jgi:hypothetical protein
VKSISRALRSRWMQPIEFLLRLQGRLKSVACFVKLYAVIEWMNILLVLLLREVGGGLITYEPLLILKWSQK